MQFLTEFWINGCFLFFFPYYMNVTDAVDWGLKKRSELRRSKAIPFNPKNTSDVMGTNTSSVKADTDPAVFFSHLCSQGHEQFSFTWLPAAAFITHIIPTGFSTAGNLHFGPLNATVIIHCRGWDHRNRVDHRPTQQRLLIPTDKDTDGQWSNTERDTIRELFFHLRAELNNIIPDRHAVKQKMKGNGHICTTLCRLLIMMQMFH